MHREDPEQLRSLSLMERSKAVVDSTDTLAPPEENAFAAGAFDLPVGDTLVQSLRTAGQHCAATELLLGALDGAAVSWPADEYGRWLREFQIWLASLDDVKRC